MTRGKDPGRRAHTPAVELRNLSFRFAPGETPVFSDLSFSVPTSARVLVIGANGVGKSTLLRILSGTHLVPAEPVRVLGASPFHDLETSARVCFVSGDFPMQLDLAVRELLTQDRNLRQRESELLELLGVSPDWRMNRVSDGQRRRVQLLLGLRRAARLLLLDEVTAHLDVTMRTDFLAWLRHDSERSGTTVLYATHIFDGLMRPPRGELWPTHLLWLGSAGKFRFAACGPLRAELRKRGGLGALCEAWIRHSG